MPRILAPAPTPFTPTTPEEDLIAKEFGPVMCVAEDDGEKRRQYLLNMAQYFFDLRRWAGDPAGRRYFLVMCDNCLDTYVISAGPRGGGWGMRCPTCGTGPGTQPNPNVQILEEAFDQHEEEESNDNQTDE